jgi:hypothetical protein
MMKMNDKPSPTSILYRYKKEIIVGLIIIAIGLFIINQFISYVYSVQLLTHPCELCIELGNVCYRKSGFNISNLTII